MIRPRAALPLLALAVSLTAQTRYEAGIRHVVSHTAETVSAGSRLELPLSRGFGASLEAFPRPRASLRLATTLINPVAILYPRNPPPQEIDLGTLGIHTTSLTARYHFRPQARISWFLGAGGTLVILGDLDDRFGDSFRADFPRQTTTVMETGVRLRYRQRLHFEVGIESVRLSATPRIRHDSDGRVLLPSSISLDPLTFGVGASWRF